MSKFRAINRPSNSPRKHTPGKRLLADAISAQGSEMVRDQGSALSPMQGMSTTPTTRTTREQPHPRVIIPAKKLRLSPRTDGVGSAQSSTAKPGAAVVPPGKQNPAQSRDTRNIGQAVAKANKAGNRKKKTSKLSKPEARREQAPREKKIMSSIEHSARKRIASFSSDCSPNGANESEYLPSPAKLVDQPFDSASDTPSRRSPRKHSSTCPSAGSNLVAGSTTDSSSLHPSPRASGTLAVAKREKPTAGQNTPIPETPLAPKPSSPSIWSSQTRKKKYKEADFVEIPKEVYDYEKIKKAEKKIREQLALKKEIMRAGKRAEKGKFAERRPVDGADDSTQSTDKRKEVYEVEQNEPRKRQKLLKSQKPVLENQSLADDKKLSCDGSQTGKQINASKLPEGKTTEKQVQGHATFVVKAEGRSDVDVRSRAAIEASSRASGASKNKDMQRSFQSHVPEDQSGESHDQTSKYSKQQGEPPSEDWRKSFTRREVPVPQIPRKCSCALLPEYFTRNPGYIPRLTTWPGGELEFFEHVKQISCCRGTVHPPHVIDACKTMLTENGYPNPSAEQSLDSIIDFANGILSSDDRNDVHLGRAQSSITPPTFYGHKQSYPLPNSVGCSSRSIQTTDKKPQSRGSHSGAEQSRPPKETLHKTLPPRTSLVHEKVQNTTILTGPGSAVVDNADGSPKQRKPSLGKRCRANIPSPRIFEDLPLGEENVAARRITKGLPEPSDGHSKSQASFNAQRKRHQSAPAHLVRRDNTANERGPSPGPTKRRHDHALQEIFNNAIHDMNRNVNSLKELLMERLPALPQTQTAPVQPAAASIAPPAAPITPAVAQDGNGAEEQHVRTGKRPSRAEQQLRLPVLDRNVPNHLRLTNEGIVDIGRIVNPYERHTKAPYAFSWSGRLWKEYHGLLTRCSNGVSVWTADEIKRLTRG
ncbi:hypothetical protein IMSHALPRED_009641 [Imshaugia aleurites]|uniref:Uncharacterized protein n=1 Tax=Imshaugia aleurites TaxID=172621 RepID=A0A8H3G0A4_9LECA|nr:hypothetical protein IMSHALPRED_009641 [Imshaugia aleurites]